MLECRLSHLEHCFTIKIRSTNIFMSNRPEREKNLAVGRVSKNGQPSRASIFLSQGRRNVWEKGDLSPPRIDRISIFHCLVFNHSLDPNEIPITLEKFKHRPHQILSPFRRHFFLSRPRFAEGTVSLCLSFAFR